MLVLAKSRSPSQTSRTAQPARPMSKRKNNTGVSEASTLSRTADTRTAINYDVTQDEITDKSLGTRARHTAAAAAGQQTASGDRDFHQARKDDAVPLSKIGWGLLTQSRQAMDTGKQGSLTEE